MVIVGGEIVNKIVLQQQQSVQMLLGKKQKPKKTKSRPKKQRTFTSSEFSLPEEHRPLSTSDLFRTDPKRRNAPPTPPAVKKNRSQKQLQATAKKRGKSRGRLDKCQTYEVIPYKNSLNSEIVFSNEETRREGELEESASQLAIRVNHQYLLDNNRLLRISIRKEYLRKVEAAVKIQKVFRGFLTRKVLQHCLEKEQRKLHDRLHQIRSESVSEHSSYFADKENRIADSKQRPLDQGVFEYSQANAEESDEEAEAVVYRHHEPIYSQDEISAYLDSSEEEEDFDRDAFDNHIIFETNEEYIDSRKSSQQPQPKSKLSRPAEPIIEEPLQTPPPIADPQVENLLKTEKKQERMKSKLEDLEGEVREETMKLKEAASQQQSPRAHPLPQFPEGEATLNRKESELECPSVERLKEEEVHRWEEVISLVQSQIGRAQDNADIGSFMQQLMELSLKNKRSLQAPSRPSSPSASLSHRQDSREKLKTLRAQRQYLVPDHPEHVVEVEKKEMRELSDRALFFEEAVQSEHRSNAAANPISPISSFDNTGQLKRFLEGNVQDQHIEEMLRLREDLLRKREAEEVRKLNLDLEAKGLQQEEFLQRLDAISHKYEEEKACINRARQDISRGHQAALRLTRQAVNDAKRLGFDLPVSRSVEGLRFKSPLLLADIVVDQMATRREDRRPQESPSPLAQLREPQERIQIDGSEAESSDLQFTEEELRRFRRAQPYDIELAEEIADLGRNVMISEELLRQQQAEENQLMMTQHVSREIYEIEEASPPRPQPLLDPLCDWLLSAVAWQAAGELMLRPVFAERLVDRSHLLRPQPVTDQQRLQFLSLLESHFPSAEALNAKLNQKICPLPGELLRCMRIDFSQEDEDDNSYEQIGKYQFIIAQEVCNEAIREFRALVDRGSPAVATTPEQAEQLGCEFGINERVVRYVQQREKYLCSRRNHTRQLRWEVLNIEVHCLFDAWNEELIFLRSQKAGYSGIGLNELTLSVRDHNWQVSASETLALISEGKQRLLRTLALSSPALLFPAVVEEDEEELLEVDSKWIFYADEALSYGLELVYLIEEDIFNECAKELRKRMLQF